MGLCLATNSGTVKMMAKEGTTSSHCTFPIVAVKHITHLLPVIFGPSEKPQYFGLAWTNFRLLIASQ